MTPAQFDRNVSHPLQTYAWGQYYKKLGFKVLRSLIREQGEDPSGIQILIQKSPVPNCAFAYVPRAALPGLRQLSYLKETGRKNACFSVKIEPDYGWLHPVSRSSQRDRQKIEKFICGQRGLPSCPVYPKHTLLLDLVPSCEEMLRTMHPKTRYNIRISERSGVKIISDSSAQCFEEFLHLFFQVTVLRAGITYPHSPKTLRLFWETLVPTGMLHLLKAVYQGETIAVMMLLRAGNKLYFPHGASSRVHKNVMANYGLMWRAMQFGKETGCTTLDLWGINGIAPGAVFPSKESGLFRFYSGFGARVFERLGAYDFIF